MSTPEFCTEEDITRLVHDFYSRVRGDEALGPIFDAHIDDWDHHLAKMVDFWSAVLKRTGRYSGTPMPRHAALPGLSAALFERWLALFLETTSAHPNQAMGAQAHAMAQRIAQSLWYGYQLSRTPEALATGLSLG